MINETALEIIGSFEPGTRIDNIEKLQALMVAMEAIEKQIPKKPLDIREPVVKWGICPNCKGLKGYQLGGRPNRVMASEKYCSHCGQAIDWDGE